MPELSFSQHFMKKLEMLKIVSRRRNPGMMRGEQRSPRYGSSVEFADYREYSEGDDIRYIDWNAYARFEDLYLKLFIEEEDLNLFILLDVSKSMSFGEPSKLDTAKRIAASLSYIAFSNYDHASIIPVGSGTARPFPLRRGKGQVFPLLDYLEGLDGEGEGDAPAHIRTFLLETRLSGVAVLISDFLYDEGYEDTLKLLAASRFQTAAIHVLSSEELNPSMSGDLKVVDSEDAEKLDVTLNRRTLRAYKRRLNAFLQDVEETCRKREICYLFADSNVNVEDFMLKECRRGQVVR
jgi:uncharacterized protein (DUF58 family)